MCHVCYMHKYKTSCALGCHYDHCHKRHERVVVDDGFHTDKPHGVISPGLTLLHVTHVAHANHVDYLNAHLPHLLAGLASPHRCKMQRVSLPHGTFAHPHSHMHALSHRAMGPDKLLNSGYGKPQQWLHHTITHLIVAVHNCSLSMVCTSCCY
jgi:hypothetical protein